LADTLLKILSPLNYLYFHPHEVDGQISPVDFRESYGILLGGDNEVRQPGFSSVDYIQDFLLCEAVMIHKSLGINQVATQLNQAFLKTDRQGDPTERRNFLPL
jgi:hypothetical protein